ncbi:Helix-turn-helix domain-containing protein [Actinopolyspora xinjiangensis]|uniref:Helix-turn-helix domain-containing protein n=1 Tax=Actinopolyspora xinjiangensis TaxID=405564 RepID=A0A1H0RMA3_9ACTN|nr:helix-turn-helix transcriptional regulator [Actinopolyspora xinjiangensis]SDP30654.1 Helix-turn-helix domain-containing protein [Actinopolyspora xinjiangensis]
MSSSPSSPTVLKRWIAFELRKLRELADISRADAGRAVRGSEQGIGHIENGRSLPGPLQLDKLLDLYGVPERSEFFQQLRARAKKGKDWWINFDFTSEVLPEYFKLFLGLESCAASIESFDAQVVSGLMQTKPYTEAVIRGVEPEIPEEEVQRRVELRLARQREVLGRAGQPPLLWSVIHESALRTPVGGVDVAREQLRHLLHLVEEPHITVQVLPMSVGAHTGIEGAFIYLAFPPELENDPGTVYVDTRVKGYYYEQPEEIAVYRAAMRRLQAQACQPEETPALISRIAKEL